MKCNKNTMTFKNDFDEDDKVLKYTGWERLIAPEPAESKVCY
jgi:hypothetical protein